MLQTWIFSVKIKKYIAKTGKKKKYTTEQASKTEMQLWKLTHFGKVNPNLMKWNKSIWFRKPSSQVMELMKVKVAQLCPTLCNTMDYTVHVIRQARILEWVAFPLSRGSSQPRNRTHVSWIAGRFFTNWTIREAQWNSQNAESILRSITGWRKMIIV